MSEPTWGYRRTRDGDPAVPGLPEGVHGEVFADGVLPEGFAPLAEVVAAGRDPLDHDGDGRRGGSRRRAAA